MADARRRSIRLTRTGRARNQTTGVPIGTRVGFPDRKDDRLLYVQRLI